MAYSDRYVGEALKVRVTPTGGSELLVTDDYTAFSHNFTQDTVDVTAGNRKEKEKLLTKEDLAWSLDVFDGDADTWNAILAAGTGVMNVRIKGDGSGLEEIEFNYIIEKGDRATGTDKAATLTMSGSRNGAMIKDFGTLQGAIRHLVFTTQPAATATGGKIPSVVVKVEDATPAVVATEQSDIITISVASGSSVASGVLSVRVINGVASFGGIIMTGAQVGETLLATSAAGYTSATSSAFTIS